MTRYSRSDVVAVNPADGCQPGHVREPGADGKFNGHWALDCPMCEVALASDPHWAGDPSDVPLTPEEKKAQARLAEQGQNNAGQMAQFFGQMMQAFQIQQLAQQPQAPAPVVQCASCGAPGMQGARFCAACGTPVTIAGSTLPADPPPAIPAPAVKDSETNHRTGEWEPGPPQSEPAAETVSPDDTPPEPAELATLKIVELRAMARDAGLSQAGSKADLVARLTEATQAG